MSFRHRGNNAATSAGECSHHLMYGQDVGLPFMTQDCIDDDTLFLCFEEDWRLENPETLDCGRIPTTVDGNPMFRMKDGQPESDRFEFKKRGTDIAKDEESVVSDLVAFANKAARNRGGDVIWMTWQPGQDDKVHRVNSIRSGAMLIGLSKTGAINLSMALEMEKITPQHWDIGLLKFVKEYGKDWFSYITPPVGNYFEHISSCERSYATKPRPSCWSTRWVCPGTRKSEDPRHRDKYLCFPTEKGDPEWLCKVDLDVEYEDLIWKTCWRVPGVPKPWEEKTASDPELIAGSTKGGGKDSELIAGSSKGESKSNHHGKAGNVKGTSKSAKSTGKGAEQATSRTAMSQRRARRSLLRLQFRNWVEDVVEVMKQITSFVSI